MIDKIHTSCKDCIFAEYNGITQIGCQFGLIEKHKDVIEAYDNEKEFYIINQRICLNKRTQEWAERFKGRNLKKVVINQLELKWHPIIFFNNTANLLKSIDSIKKQKIQPIHVTVINPAASPVPAHKITKWIKGFASWRVQGMEDEISRYDQIDLVIDKYRYPLYFIIDAGFELDSNMINKLNTLINEELLTFGMIINEEKTLYIIPTIMHERFGGNAFGVSLEEKIREKCPQTILNYETIIK